AAAAFAAPARGRNRLGAPRPRHRHGSTRPVVGVGMKAAAAFTAHGLVLARFGDPRAPDEERRQVSGSAPWNLRDKPCYHPPNGRIRHERGNRDARHGGEPGAPMIVTVLIFVATYFVVAIGRLPGFRLDRAGAALIGAALMVAVGALSADEAFRAIDLDTIALLLGMMIVVANLRLAGFFALCHGWIVRRAHRPILLLIGIAGVAGLLSEVLVNDTVCLMLTPLVVETVRDLKRSPAPYLLALAMASNAGGVATITGNPQNMMIGSLSRIAYG